MFLVELSSQYTAYSLHGNVLKSKWSQRMYELCQNGKVQTASESVDELRGFYFGRKIQPVCASK
jgi:hypothetical protein